MLCVIAGQRAGTTALRGALDRTKQFKDLKEIFQNTNQPGAYVKFLKQEGLQGHELLDHKDMMRVIGRYYTFLETEATGRVPIIDVKFNSWGALNPAFHYVCDTPLFMTYLMRKLTKFLLISREDLASQVFSAVIARRAKKWHYLEEGDVQDSFSVGLNYVRHQARLIIQSENLFLSSLDVGYNHWTHVTYEALYSEGAVCEGVVSWIEQQFDLQLERPIAPLIRKNEGTTSAIIDNYDQALEEIRKVEAKYPRMLSGRLH